MKKLIFVLLISLCCAAGVSAKTVFVYFSATGTTEKMAKNAASVMDADIFKIQPAQEYTSADQNWHDKNSRTSIECNDPKSRPTIANKIDISRYDTVVLCYPIWWGYAAKIMYTYVESQDWNGKNLITLCTSGSSGLGQSGADLAKYAKGANYLGGRDFTRAKGEDVKKFIEGLLPKETAPVVYFIKDITPEALVKVYKATGYQAKGKTGVKVSTGESEKSNYLRPALIKNLVKDELNATIVECNTAYGGNRSNNIDHMKIAKDHGFLDVANGFDLQDADGYMTIPVKGGVRLKENYVGTHFTDYDTYLILSHFKGHAMGGFGGAIKNLSIGFASGMSCDKSGKLNIHSAGRSTTSWTRCPQDEFLESMAEAAKSICDYMQDGKGIVCVNVMNRLSVDCDCDGNPAEPDMHDIGILASLDPVALDQACVDLVYKAKDSKSLIERIESRNGIHTLEHAEKIGFGSRKYQLVEIK